MQIVSNKCHILFSVKNKKSVVNLSSAELSWEEVKVKIVGKYFM